MPLLEKLLGVPLDIKLVDVNKLKPDKDQPRQTFDEEALQNMAETFKTQGVIQPIEIDENNRIITGEMRWRASKIAGISKVPVKVLKGLSEQDIQFRRYIENWHRQELKPKEYIPHLKQLWKVFTKEYKSSSRSQDEGLSEFARRLGKNKEWIRSILELEERAKPEVIQAWKREEISTKMATEISKAPRTIQPELLREAKREGTTFLDIQDRMHAIKKTKLMLEPTIEKKTPRDWVSIVSHKFLEFNELMPSDPQKRKIAVARLSSEEYENFGRSLLKTMENNLTKNILPFYKDLKKALS